MLEVSLPPEHEAKAQLQLLAIMGRQLEILADLGLTPVALVRAQDRRRLSRLTRLSFPDLTVLSREEVVLPINVLDVSQAGPAHG